MSQLKPFLYEQSVAFFTFEHGDDISLASGTLVSIADKLFIATHYCPVEFFGISPNH